MVGAARDREAPLLQSPPGIVVVGDGLVSAIGGALQAEQAVVDVAGGLVEGIGLGLDEVGSVVGVEVEVDIGS